MCNKWKILPCFVCGLSGVLFLLYLLSFIRKHSRRMTFQLFTIFHVFRSRYEPSFIGAHSMASQTDLFSPAHTHTHNWIEDLLFGFDFSLFCWQLVQQQLHQCFYKQTSKQMPLNVDVKSKVSRIVRKTWIKSGPSEKNRERKECITT